VLNEKHIRSLKALAKISCKSGGAKDFAEYREVCGVIRGLNAALREVGDLSRNYMDDNDD
jgi:hypothetical protein